MGRYLKAMKKRSQNIKDRLQRAYHLVFAPQKETLNQYNQEAPHPQQMIDLFKNEWMSAFPPPFQDLKAGIYPLFADERLIWGMEALGGVENKKIIELGPLEGGHSYLVQKEGAASVVAIEANPRAYLRCLLVKEMLKLNRVDFLFGDFNAYLRSSLEHFDVCIASGVFYHMSNPMELLALIAQKSDNLFLWTQYYDEKVCQSTVLKSKFLSGRKAEVKGFKHTLYPFKYGASRFWSTFIGGPARTSSWLSRQDILAGLNHFGFKDVQIAFEELYSPHGPSFALVAKKSH